MGNTYEIQHYQTTYNHRRLGMKPNHKALLIWHLLAALYYISTSFGAEAQNERNYRLVDLTHTFDNTTLYWVTEPTLKLNVTHNGTAAGQNFWYQKEEIYAATHGGTHLDAPCHFAKGRWCVSDIPLERLVVPAVVIDISLKVKGNPSIHLTKEMLLEWEALYKQIPDGSVLLVYTGWSAYWPDRLKYTGTNEANISLLNFPSIKADAARWLVANRRVVGVGIDTMSVDIPNERPGTHVTLMENNIYGLENVNNIDRLPPIGAMIYVMPMKLKDASGAPCRLLAQVPMISSGNNTSAYMWLLIITIFIVFMFKL